MKNLLCALLALSLSALAAEVPSPLFHCTFDSAEAVAAAGGKTLPGGKAEWVEGRNGRALSFGTELMPNNQPSGGVFFPKWQLDQTKPFTILAAVRLAPVAATPKGFRSFKDIIGNGGTRGPGIRMTIFYGFFLFNSGDGKTPASVQSQPAKAPVPIDRWFQLACVFDGKTATIYCDGKPVASGPVAIRPNRRPLCVLSNNGNAYGFPGAMDDLKVWQQALTTEQMAKLYLDYAE